MTRVTYPASNLKKYIGDQPKNGTLVIEIDYGRIARSIGAKAAFNKNGKSRALGGAVVVKFIPNQE